MAYWNAPPCPPETPFVLLKDADKKGLRLRITKAGGKHWQFETRIKGALFTRALGEWPAISIGEAQAQAHMLRGIAEKGIDPRTVEKAEAEALAEQAAAKDADKQRQQAADALQQQRQTVTGLQAWDAYLTECKAATKPGHPDKPKWGARTLADHITLSAPGGVAYKRKSAGTTQPGPLHNVLNQPLVQIDSATVAAWLKAENIHRPTQAALAFRLLRAFLNWCAEHPTFNEIAKTDAHSTKAVRNHVAKQKPKTDALQREHLPAWFAGVLADTNQHARAYLVGLLLTGARANELAGLRWEDVNLKFGGTLTLHDKVEGLRVIPCPAYLAHLLAALPRPGPWVFGMDSERPNVDDTAAYNHKKALTAGGLPHVSLHGLRRSFKSLTEWVECPAGIVAQIMGHKPSATAEKHYTVRPVDLLRLWHEKIEAWMLEQAGVKFDRAIEPGKLALVG
jgi:integrase